MKTKERSLLLRIPHVGEVFELACLTAVPDPIGMVRSGDYDDADKWMFRGPHIVAPESGFFKIVRIGYMPNVEAANVALAHYGRPALGQWCEVFKEKYPHPDREGPIGFTGSQWVGYKRPRSFASIQEFGGKWDQKFTWGEQTLSKHWRLVVQMRTG